MQITNLNNAKKVPFNLDGRIMFSDKRIELVHLTLNPGEGLDMHKNPFDVVFYVLEGKGLLTIETESEEINANSVISVSKEKLRAWKNNSKKALRLLVIKVLD